MRRHAISFSKLSLTDFTVKISRSARQKQVKRAFEEADIVTKWEQTAWAKRIARKVKRAQLTDFDRFKLRVLRQQVCAINTFINAHVRVHTHTYTVLYMY